MTALRIYYSDNALWVDTIDTPFVAGTLAAAADPNGVNINITRADGTYRFVSPPWTDIAAQDGTTFATPDAVMAYLTSQFSMRRPVGGVSSFTAGTDLGGHKALMFANDGSGNVVYADPQADDYVFAGVSLGAALAGSAVQAMTSGLVAEPSWSWQPADPVYVGQGGALTQQPPAIGLFHLLGFAPSAMSILLSPAPLVIRA